MRSISGASVIAGTSRGVPGRHGPAWAAQGRGSGSSGLGGGPRVPASYVFENWSEPLQALSAGSGARHGRPDRARERVVRNRVARHLVQMADGQDHELEIRQWVRPWTYEVHVATEDVDELWKLVEPEPPEQPPDACDPIIVVPLPLRRRPADRPHSAELHQLEGSPTHSHALLDEEHGAAGVELDEKHDQTEDRRQHDQSDDRREEAERPRERVLQT